MPSAPHPTVAEFRAVGDWWWRKERLSGAVAAFVLCLWSGHTMLADNVAEREEAGKAESAEAASSAADLPRGEYVIAGYGGAPYTHPSDVKFSKPGTADLTVHDITWEGRPFKSPVYYGIRTLQWSSGGTFGGMLDFTHSKAISQRDQEIRLSGSRNGQIMTGKARLGDVFRHFEFSHGHNTLTVNGLARLPSLLPGLAPYLGGGVGVALPHTEVHFNGDPKRTYEYQYVGPAAQAVLGMELRLPHASIFLEYKFIMASYQAPMTGLDGGWFPGDLWRQAMDILRGASPVDGYLSTVLASHQVAAGVGLRVMRAPTQPGS
jgi:lipid A oxidase